MKVKDCMCTNVNSVKEDTSVKDCAKLMCDCHIGCAPVCDDNDNLVGIITDRDILLRTVACNKDTCNTKVSEVMTKNPCYCECDCNVQEAEKLMQDNQIRRIPVLQGDKVIGIITLGDLAQNQNINDKEVCDTVYCICKHSNKNAE